MPSPSFMYSYFYVHHVYHPWFCPSSSASGSLGVNILVSTLCGPWSISMNFSLDLYHKLWPAMSHPTLAHHDPIIESHTTVANHSSYKVTTIDLKIYNDIYNTIFVQLNPPWIYILVCSLYNVYRAALVVPCACPMPSSDPIFEFKIILPKLLLVVLKWRVQRQRALSSEVLLQKRGKQYRGKRIFL